MKPPETTGKISLHKEVIIEIIIVVIQDTFRGNNGIRESWDFKGWFRGTINAFFEDLLMVR